MSFVYVPVVSEFQNYSFLTVTANDSSVEGINTKPAKKIFKFLLFIGAFNIILNLSVIYVSIFKVKAHKVTSMLIANLSVISICIAIVNILYPGDKVILIKVTGHWCFIIPYMKSILFTAFPMNLVAIIYERIQNIRDNRSSLQAVMLSCIVWLISIIFNFPVVGMSREQEDDSNAKIGTYLEHCERVALLGSFDVTLIYELARLGIFHLLVTLYMVYAVVKVRTKLGYLLRLSSAPNERMKRKIFTIYWFYFHVISLCILWLPIGIFIFIRKVMDRRDDERGTQLRRDFGGAYGGLFLLLYVYIEIAPLISLLIFQDNKWRICNWLCCKTSPTDNVVPNDPHLQGDRKADETEQAVGNEQETFLKKSFRVQGDTSRVSTFDVSKDPRKLEERPCETCKSESDTD